jgi:hypothetical protein
MALVLPGAEGRIMAARHSHAVDPQEGAVEDHERLPASDLDRLVERGCHRGEQGDRFA